MSCKVKFSSCKHLPQITVKVKTLFYHLANQRLIHIKLYTCIAKILLLLNVFGSNFARKKSDTHSYRIASLVCMSIVLKVIVHS